jgi:nitroreductase
METLKCIESRVSIRKYAKMDEMGKEDITTILKAGMEAPSAMNRRPYELLVNTDNGFWKDFVAEKPTCSIAATAALTILVIGDSNKNPTNEFMIEDAAVVSENMLLAATELGYGSLWAGIKFDSDFYKKIISYFKLPAGYMPVSLLIFGKAGEKKGHEQNRYEKSKIHFGKF